MGWKEKQFSITLKDSYSISSWPVNVPQSSWHTARYLVNHQKKLIY